MMNATGTLFLRPQRAAVRVVVVAFFVTGLLAHRANGQSYLLSVSGSFDASDTISIGGSTAQWQHNFDQYPTGVSLNGQVWDPQSNPSLTFASPLIPANLSGYAVRVQRFQARDAATAEVVGNNLVVSVDDTPLGASFYQFNIALIPEVSAPSSTPATLHITGTIDGSDRVVINPAGATWMHQYYSTPTNMSLNGVSWNPSTTSFLPNSGATQFLPAGVSMENVSIQKTAGRDLASVETQAHQIALFFADNPVGSGSYDVTLSFPGNPLRAPNLGDANTDGTTDFNDLVAIQSHYGLAGMTWSQGDFNLDGIVNESDLQLLAQNYDVIPPTDQQLSQFNPTYAAAVRNAFAAVPEPSSAAFFVLMAATLCGGRRRREIRE